MKNKRKVIIFYSKIVFTIIIIFHTSFFLTTGIYLFIYKNTNPTISSIMSYRKINHGYEVMKPGFIPLRKIPLDIMSSVIFIEDFDFYLHHGIDIKSIQFALKINQKLGFFAYGGSTLTQQLARTLFLNPKKNYIRKYLEILIALEMELLLSKERILELYFNYAEWGKNVYGINDAAYYHYKRPLQTLDDEEKLCLITILANPIKYTPYTFKKNKMLLSRYIALSSFNTIIKELPPHFKSTIQEKNE